MGGIGVTPPVVDVSVAPPVENSITANASDNDLPQQPVAPADNVPLRRSQ